MEYFNLIKLLYENNWSMTAQSVTIYGICGYLDDELLNWFLQNSNQWMWPIGQYVNLISTTILLSCKVK